MFSFQQLQNTAASSAFTLSEAATRGILRKCVLKNFAKFLRTPFLQNTSEQLLLSVKD